MDLIGLATNYFLNYPHISIFLIALIVGTEPLLFVTFLAGAQGNVSFWTIYFFSIISLIIADGLYYLIGRSEFIRHITPRSLKKRKYQIILNKIKKHTYNNLFFILIISKFIYGFRHVMNIYSGYNKIKYIDYLKRDIPALVIFFSIMLPIAWFAGIGTWTSLGSIKRIELIIAAGLIFMFLMYFLGKLLLNKLIKE